MKVYEASDVEEAVELANKFKTEGHYNWFRGQVQDWPLYSSLGRIKFSGDDESMEIAYFRIALFSKWVSERAELRYLIDPNRVNDFYAIAQHYGIPTNYIDFTTDPGIAGFFAAHTTNPPQDDKKSCIYCLNTDELFYIWGIIESANEGAELELVTIDVQNLWRLKAQRGVFLYANFNLADLYPMDRILFPYTGYPSFPTYERVYPMHKSALEQLMDQYLHVESRKIAEKVFYESGEDEKYDIVHWNAHPEGVYIEAFTNKQQLFTAGSWDSNVLQSWEVYPSENYVDVLGPSFSVKLKPQASVEDNQKSVSFAMRQILRSEPTVRARAVEWIFTDLPESVSQHELTSAFRLVWNGMRCLPYSDEDIADALASIVALL